MPYYLVEWIQDDTNTPPEKPRAPVFVVAKGPKQATARAGLRLIRWNECGGQVKVTILTPGKQITDNARGARKYYFGTKQRVSYVSRSE
jgi:hypothetical protein